MFPSTLQIQTISYCNYDCLICPYPNVKGLIKQGRMTDEIFERILNECEHYKSYVKNIFLMLMNEPLLDSDIDGKVKQTKEKLPDCRVIIVTNGSLLNEDVSRRLLASKLDVLKVSINYHYTSNYLYKERGEEIDLLQENIENFIKMNNKQVRLIISIVDNKLNNEQVLKNLKFWEQQNVECIVSPLSNRAGAINQFDRLVSSHSKSYDYGKKCTIPFTILNILFDGRVVLCCNDWYQNAILGNIQINDIHSIWTGLEINKYRKAIIYKNVEHIQPCNKCKMSI